MAMNDNPDSVASTKAPQKGDVTPSKAEKKPSSSSVEDEEKSWIELVRTNRPFRLFLIYEFIDEFGGWVLSVACAVAFAEMNRVEGEFRGNLHGILHATRYFTQVLLLPLGGAIADAYDQRKVLLAISQVRILLCLGFFLAFQQQSILLVFLISVLYEILTGIHNPVVFAMVPLMIGGEEDTESSTYITEMHSSFMTALGNGVGGFIVDSIGVRACTFFNATTLVWTMMILWTIGSDWRVEEEDDDDEDDDDDDDDESMLSTMYNMIAGGIGYLRTSVVLPFVFLKFCAAFVQLDVIVSTIAETKPNPAKWIGILYGSYGVGSLLAPVLAKYLNKSAKPEHLLQRCVVAFTIAGLACISMSLEVIPFPLYVLLFGIKSMAITLIWVNSDVLMVKYTKTEVYGRVSSIDYGLALIGETLSSLGAGALIDELELTPEQASAVAGGCGLIAAVGWGVYCINGGGRIHDHENKRSKIHLKTD